MSLVFARKNPKEIIIHEFASKRISQSVQKVKEGSERNLRETSAQNREESKREECERREVQSSSMSCPL